MNYEWLLFGTKPSTPFVRRSCHRQILLWKYFQIKNELRHYASRLSSLSIVSFCSFSHVEVFRPPFRFSFFCWSCPDREWRALFIRVLLLISGASLFVVIIVLISSSCSNMDERWRDCQPFLLFKRFEMTLWFWTGFFDELTFLLEYFIIEVYFDDISVFMILVLAKFKRINSFTFLEFYHQFV